MYGIDCGTPGLLQARSWHWLKSRVEQLLTRPPTVVFRPNGASVHVPSTRIGLQLQPPKQED